jgi:hypothetical protein
MEPESNEASLMDQDGSASPHALTESRRASSALDITDTDPMNVDNPSFSSSPATTQPTNNHDDAFSSDQMDIIPDLVQDPSSSAGPTQEDVTMVESGTYVPPSPNL